jgi:hypothetical protein
MHCNPGFQNTYAGAAAPARVGHTIPGRGGGSTHTNANTYNFSIDTAPEITGTIPVRFSVPIRNCRGCRRMRGTDRRTERYGGVIGVRTEVNVQEEKCSLAVECSRCRYSRSESGQAPVSYHVDLIPSELKLVDKRARAQLTDHLRANSGHVCDGDAGRVGVGFGSQQSEDRFARVFIEDPLGCEKIARSDDPVSASPPDPALAQAVPSTRSSYGTA